MMVRTGFGDFVVGLQNPIAVSISKSQNLKISNAMNDTLY